jgi:YD repeat-containing protein
MRNSLCLIAACILTFGVIQSCKKADKTCSLGKHYLSDGSTTPVPDVFFYYDNAKLKRIEHTDGSKDTVSYNADTITVLTYDRYNVLASVYTGVVNGGGAAISAVKNTFNNSGTLTGNEAITYEYNTEGRLTKQTTVNSSGTSILVIDYTNGNSTTGSVHVGPVTSKKYYFFHGTTENKTNVDDLNGVFMPWLGQPSANLLDSMHILSPAISDTVRVQYTHTLDANGYLDKTSETTFHPGVSTKIHAYQYFHCQ